MDPRRLVATLVLCSLAWVVRGCAVAPWEAQKQPEQGTPPPVANTAKIKPRSEPEERAQPKSIRATELPKTLEPKPLPRQQPPPEIASAPRRQPSPPERPRIDPDLKNRPVQELTLEPRPAPAQPVPMRESGPPSVPEPGQKQEPAPESLPAPLPKPAQAAQEPALMGEPAPPEAPEPTSSQPPTLEPTEETASLPKPSLIEPIPDLTVTRSADEAPLTTSDLFSPEPIATKPAIILSRDDQPDERFDEELEHGRSEITRTPRWLREPSPPLLLADGEP
jgi:hypothetical protein